MKPQIPKKLYLWVARCFIKYAVARAVAVDRLTSKLGAEKPVAWVLLGRSRRSCRRARSRHRQCKRRPIDLLARDSAMPLDLVVGTRIFTDLPIQSFESNTFDFKEQNYTSSNLTVINHQGRTLNSIQSSNII